MSKPFQFKQFSLRDDKCAMKIGTDGVLLGAWVSIDSANTILDIGTGCGLIALMLAQRSGSTSKIEAVEIEEESASQAQENVASSPWPDKVKINYTSIQDFHPNYKFDLIVSNPPFFNKSLPPPSDKRKSARHADSLSYTDLLTSVNKLLADDGHFSLVLPAKEGSQFISLAQFQGLYPKRQCAVFSRIGKPQERWLIEFSRRPGTVVMEKLILFEGQNERSKEYKILTEEFYL